MASEKLTKFETFFHPKIKVSRAARLYLSEAYRSDGGHHWDKLEECNKNAMLKLIEKGDERGLEGEYGVISKHKIRKGGIIMHCEGLFMMEDEYQRWTWKEFNKYPNDETKQNVDDYSFQFNWKHHQTKEEKAMVLVPPLGDKSVLWQFCNDGINLNNYHSKSNAKFRLDFFVNCPIVSIQSTRDIGKYEEINVDYGVKYWKDRGYNI